jgi:hypothetical protein
VIFYHFHEEDFVTLELVTNMYYRLLSAACLSASIKLNDSSSYLVAFVSRSIEVSLRKQGPIKSKQSKMRQPPTCQAMGC